MYMTDPNSAHNTFPIPGAVISELPIASIAPMAPMVPIVPIADRGERLPLVQRQQRVPLAPLISFPPHVTRLIIDNAISNNDTSTCIISSEDLTHENASVTKCGHVFTTQAIKEWLASPSSRGECPICKQQCQ
jgi:hypothetical protein